MKRLSLYLFCLLTNISCFASTDISEEAKQNALNFINAIQSQDYAKAFQLTENGMKWRLDGMRNNNIITTEEEFIKLAPIIFNNVITSNKPPLDVDLSCCLSSSAVLTGKDINENVTFYFWDDGTPNVLINSTIALPSFDCSNAASDVEITICKNHKLSLQDQNLGHAYKDARRFFTGKAQHELKEMQIQFVRKRSACGKNVNCIYSNTEKRIDYLENQLSHEFSSPNENSAKNGKALKGEWTIDGDIIYANNVFSENYRIEKTIQLEDAVIYINSDNKIDIHRKEKREECYIDNISHDSYAHVYYQTAYQQYYFGREGEDFSRLPFSVNYSTYDLKYKHDPERSCGVIVRSGVNNDVFFYSEGYIDKSLVSDGYLLKPLNQ